ncbi:MAG TPA: hypothetical protein VLT36_10790 [Candidatus Dormibacteraeota bacterium]|nr:hypothetical protein [Candidatus Dormibacteraeota bacterium]
MQIQMVEMIRVVAALVAGGVIGYAFGLIQKLARARNEKRQERGELNNGWSVMPGSGRRVGYLVIALVLVQILCPLLFVGASQWCVSVGVVLGYGAVLFWSLKERQSCSK